MGNGHSRVTTPAPRLHAYLRPGSPTALVIRQGPSTTFCTIGWDLARDRFTVGQWVKHKLYPERGDLSPDGKWHIYFALNGRWSSETKGSWTGLARVPYLKCVRMWPQGDTWGGGGAIVPAKLAPGVEETPPLPNTLRYTYLSRPEKMIRDGWERPGKGFEKRAGDFVLRKKFGNAVQERHELIGPGGEMFDRRSWVWADVDEPRGRIVYAEDGRIYSVSVKKPLAAGKLLFDAHGMTFEAIAAPY